MNHYSCKRHNTLTLAQRVEVIREYDLQVPKPKILTLKEKYNVSFLQIKNILQNRESILKEYYESCGGDANDELHDQFIRQRQEKIDFLGKVMYEYIQRSMHQNLALSDEKILQKAVEIKESIAVVNFRPNFMWLNDFKKVYGIPRFDLSTLRNNVAITDPKRQSLSTVDLITFVTNEENKKETKKKRDSTKRKPNQIVFMRATSPPPLIYHKIPKRVCKPTSNENNIPIQTASRNIECPSLELSLQVKQEPVNTKNVCSNCSPRDIKSVEEALEHLKLLEEYAMLHDNFRAIGLLTQLEDVFKKPTDVD